jgi:hypothetical protein
LANKKWKEIVVFLALTLVFSSVFWVIIIVSGFQSKNAVFYVFGLMWSPGVAAIFTSLIFQKSLRHLGWRWGKTRYQLLSIFLPIVYAVVSYSVVWLVGWGRINKDFSLDFVQFLTIGILLSLLFSLICFTLMVTGTSFAYAWLRLISGSVWTGMFLHAMHNHFVQSFFDPLTGDTGITPNIIGEFGAALAVAGIVVAFIFWKLRHRLNHSLIR